MENENSSQVNIIIAFPNQKWAQDHIETLQMTSSYSITVFTPTFNRAYCLERAYQSLCSQTNKDFEWLIIDDGSSDNTKDLITQWEHEGIVPIRYIYQDNQGMHGAHNTAFRNMETELSLCLDSDDMLTDDCIDVVLNFWNEHKDQQKEVAGFIALDGYMDGSVIGTKFPQGILIEHEYRLRELMGVRGDKKIIFRNAIAKQAPEYPVFPDEKYGSMAYKNQYIDDLYPWLLLNRIIYLVEYLEDGSSRNMFKQYRRALKGWDIARKDFFKHNHTWKYKFKECIHYISNSIFLHKWSFVYDSPNPLLTIATIPFGIALNLLVRFKTRNGY
jgi:glycosyltransferase involved in cell wall biosynthesis